MPTETILVVDDAREMRDFIAAYVLRPQGYQVYTAENGTAGLQLFRSLNPDLIISDINMPDLTGFELARIVRDEQADLPVILITAEGSESVAREAMLAEVADYLSKPFDPQELLDAITRALQARRERAGTTELASANDELKRRLKELEVLTSVAHNVTSMLDLDQVLSKVVEEAVSLTGAEEGSLLLLDQRTGELTMRAAKNFDDNFARTFRLRSDDSLAGSVIRTGEPVRLGETEPQKIKTAYLVYSLVYVPLKVHGRIIGVLGVDNREAGRVFTAHDQQLLEALGDYAAIAIENARLYFESESERAQLETILREMEDGVLVLNGTDHLLLMNPTARAVFGVAPDLDVAGRPVGEVLNHLDLRTLIAGQSRLSEVAMNDGRVYNAHLTPIPGVGRAIFMQDITHLKELDRIKSEFVTTVSHDLRSPLTAILGYLELIKRVGEVTPQQAEFMQFIQANVRSINELINNLLDLGRIEGGFDSQKEPTPLSLLLEAIAVEMRPQAELKHQTFVVAVDADLHPVAANAPRLRQLVANLVNNAIKYTPENGLVRLSAHTEGDLNIISISDSGIGIPLTDQPYIFDKFFRGSNARAGYVGTGLGLSIVKSIVDDHDGRIWVESQPGLGATFTVMLPKHKPPRPTKPGA